MTDGRPGRGGCVPCAGAARYSGVMRALIVDDEPIARRKIRDHLRRHADIEVVGECGDLGEARGAVERLKPDLLFLDLRLPGGDGLSFLDTLGPEAPVTILVTALSDRALDAFDLAAADYLLKPFDDRRFARSLDRARALLKARGTAAAPAPQAAAAERLPVPDKEGIRLVRTSEVDWIEAEGNYAALHVGGRRHLIRTTLENLVGRLPPEQFVRVSRSAVVNIDRIARLEPWMGKREFMIVLSTGSRVKLSRNYRAEFETRVGRLS